LQTLRSLVQPFILRRIKTDREIIQDLPEKQEMMYFVALRALYQRRSLWLRLNQLKDCNVGDDFGYL